MIGGVIFDLGDTLILGRSAADSGSIWQSMAADLTAWLQNNTSTLPDPAVFQQRFLHHSAQDKLRRDVTHVEYSTAAILAQVYTELGWPLPTPQQAAAALHACYAPTEVHWDPAPGVHQMLQALQQAGCRLAIVSNAGDSANVQRLIDRHNLRAYFDPIVVSADLGIRKPDARIFDALLNQWQLPPAQLAMVGDTLAADVLGAHNAGLRSVWLRTRASRADNVAHTAGIIPDAAIDTLAELPAVLRNLPEHAQREPMLSIIIPVFNEVATITNLVERVRRVPLRHELVLIDDASTDGSRALLDQLAQAPDTIVIHHAVNRGKGTAIASGLAAASGAVAVIQDADLEYDPQDFVRMLAPIREGRAQVVYGARNLESQRPLMRFGNQMLSALTRILYGSQLSDMETCYKMMTRAVYQTLALECRRFDVEAEITAKVLRAGHRIHEVPIRYTARYENKKLSPLDGLPTLRALFKYRFWRS